jgi:hypothetical protein
VRDTLRDTLRDALRDTLRDVLRDTLKGGTCRSMLRDPEGESIRGGMLGVLVQTAGVQSPQNRRWPRSVGG